jgi:hypothetical protein
MDSEPTFAEVVDRLDALLDIVQDLQRSQLARDRTQAKLTAQVDRHAALILSLDRTISTLREHRRGDV